MYEAMASELRKTRKKKSYRIQDFYTGSHKLERVLPKTELSAMINGHFALLVVKGRKIKILLLKSDYWRM